MITITNQTAESGNVHIALNTTAILKMLADLRFQEHVSVVDNGATDAYCRRYHWTILRPGTGASTICRGCAGRSGHCPLQEFAAQSHRRSGRSGRRSGRRPGQPGRGRLPVSVGR